MIQADILQRKLEEVREKLREVWRRRVASWLLVATALIAVGIGLSVPVLGTNATLLAPLIVVALGITALILNFWSKRKTWTDVEIARMIENRHPDLDALVLTAFEKLDADESDPAWIFRDRLLKEAADRGAVQNWPETVSRPAMNAATWRVLAAAIVCMAACLWMLRELPTPWKNTAEVTEVKAAENDKAASDKPVKLTLTVTPGDTEIERGSRLVVEAKVEPEVPETATLIHMNAAGKEVARVPMRLNVDATTFGALLAKITEDGKYRVEAGDAVSPEFKITTFVYPALVRSDVTITPPEYTHLPAKEIKNTLKVTAIEGSQISFNFRINKAVKEAELFGEDKTVLTLKPAAGDPTLLTGALKAEKSQKWRVHLVDQKERANKNPPWISITVQSNQLAKIEVVFPKRDVQVSAIQELPVEAKIWDDLGVTRSGAEFTIAGKSKEVLFKNGTTKPAKKEDVKAMLALEKEGAEPRQLVSYYFWAEDTGPQGEIRRSMSDMFFADVRHFEDIFREGEPPPSEPGKPGGKKGETDELVDLQKQVVNATWRLIRDTGAGRTMEAAAPDVEVVTQGQQQALDKTKEAMEKVEDAEIKTALTEAWKSMRDVLGPLGQAAQEKKRASLNQALGFEQSALEWLHRAQSREHVVMKQNSKSPSASGGQQAMKNQLMDLELKQEEQRYEEQKQASAEQSAEQQENLQVLSRLKELARRQEALAEKMKELQKQIEKAKTEEEKQELENQLKRLQDEQEQLLRDVDDLKNKMEQSENAANMADAKQQLDETREKVMDAAEQLKQEKLTDAANSATRAQRDLEKMQEDFKQKTAKRFTDEMKQLRSQARDVAERQKEISDQLEAQKTRDESKAGDTSAALEKLLDGSQVARQMEEQAKKVNELLEEMRRISEQAEGNNPLLHRNLYEAVRQAQTSGLEENLQEAKDHARVGSRADAQEAERKATASVEDLKKGVEKAAESVLGSETEALRMARAELDKLIKDVGEQQTAAGQTPPAPRDPNAKTPEPTPGKVPPAGKTPEGMTQQQPTPPSGPTPESPPPPKDAVANEKAEDPSKKPEVPVNAVTPPASQTNPPQMGENQKTPEEGEKVATANPNSAQSQSKDGGYKPGDDPGNPGKSKDKFATYGLVTKPGERGGSGMDQNKPSEGGAPAPAGEGLPKDAKAPETAANQPLETGTGQFPQPPPGPKPQGQPNGENTSQNPPAPGDLAQGRGQRPPDGQEDPSAPPSEQENRNSGKNGQASSQPGQARGGQNRGGASHGGDEGGLFFEETATEVVDGGPVTGDRYEDWSDRLRNVEDLLNRPELRNEAAKVLDNARAMRIDHQRSNEAPQVSHLQARILNPLVELRDRVAEELARRDTNNPMVPVDRDPVPPAYRDLVRRYYTELGNGK